MILETPEPDYRFDLGRGFSVLAGRDPFVLAVSRDGGATLRTHRPSPLVLGDGVFEDRVARIVTGEPRDGAAAFRLATERGREAILTVSLEGEGPDVRLTLEAPEPRARLGFNFDVEGGEGWFGADVLASTAWPLNSARIDRDSWLSSDNQTSPIWLSSRGLCVLNGGYQRIGFQFNAVSSGTFSLYAMDSASFSPTVSFGSDIRDAHRRAMQEVGTPGKAPPREYFEKPAYSTWINFLTNVTQSGVENFVDDMAREGFGCGVFMIDDKWMPRYGDLDFDGAKFPDPGALVGRLHARGMKVSVWVTPFVDRDSSNYRFLERNGYLVLRKDGVGIFHADWWNGNSALVDLSNPDAREWFLSALRSLRDRYGIDGFKFDAGDGAFLRGGYATRYPMNPLEYTDAFARLGADFPVNELRVSWLTQRDGLVQRLRDKAPTWSETDGLGAIIPHGLTEGLIGYPFFSADMIGGGWDVYFRDSANVDEELFVRWTEACALFPIMQFSYAPWRLSPDKRAICRRYAALHESLSGYIYELAQGAAETGFPIVAPIFLHFPEEKASYAIRDEFMLGDLYLVAPVVTKGATSRDVYLPPGIWEGHWGGEIFEGPAVLREVSAPLDTLPLYRRTERAKR